MAQLRNARIVSSGISIPEKKVTNADLEKIMDTSDEWIRKRSGIKERYYASHEESTSDLGAAAAMNALQEAKLKPKDIDLILTATLSPDYNFPGIGVLIQRKLGLDTTPAMDIRNQCSGFIYALATGNAMIASGQYDRIMIVCSEIHSKILNMSTAGRDVAVLFGDGAGAVILEATEASELGIISTHLYSQGEYAEKLWLERPGTAGESFISDKDIQDGLHFPRMEGRTVFKHATMRLSECVRVAINKNNINSADVDHFLFHQANIRINESVCKDLGLNKKKVYENISRYGNCSAASLPILIHENRKNGNIKAGDLALLAAFGAGFTWGSCLLRW